MEFICSISDREHKLCKGTQYFSHPFLDRIWRWFRELLLNFESSQISSTSYGYQMKKCLGATLLIFHPPADFCFDISGFPKSSLFLRNSFMLLFTIAIWPNLWFQYPLLVIPAILTLTLAMQLALANGILANVTQVKVQKGLMHWSLFSFAALWNSHTSMGRSLVKPTGGLACEADINHSNWVPLRPAKPLTTRYVSEVIWDYLTSSKS